MQKIHIGRLSARISLVLELLGSSLPKFSHILVRELDSDHEPTNLERILRRFGLVATTRPDGALLESRDAGVLLRPGVLAGFDELWFLEAEPPTTLSISPDCVLRPLAVDLRSAVPADFCAEMRRTACVLAVADGLGMNFATTDAQLAEALHSTFELHSGD